MMAPPTKQRRAGPPSHANGSPAVSHDAAGGHGVTTPQRATNKDFAGDMKTGTAFQGEGNRPPSAKRISAAREHSTSQKAGLADAVSGADREIEKSPSGITTEGSAAFAARWTPVIKAEAALVVSGYRSRYMSETPMVTALKSTEKEEFEDAADSPASVNPTEAVRSGTVSARDSRQTTMSNFGNEDAATTGESTRDKTTSCGLFELWGFCCAYVRMRKNAPETACEYRMDNCTASSEDPRGALCGVGLRLTGPYDLFAGDLPLGEHALLMRSRGFYDMPECQPVLCACDPRSISAASFFGKTIPPLWGSVSGASPPSSSLNEKPSVSDTPFPSVATSASVRSHARGSRAAEVSRTTSATPHPASDEKAPAAGRTTRVAASSRQVSAAATEEAAAAPAAPASPSVKHYVLGNWKIPADYHVSLLRDREAEVPHAVVANAPSEGPTFSVIAAACNCETPTAAASKRAKASSETRRNTPLGSSPRGTSSREETGKLVHSGTASGEQRKSVRKGHTEAKLTKILAAKEGILEAGSRGEEAVAKYQEQRPRVTTGMGTAHEKTAEEIPLLLAVVLLHCQAIIDAHQEAPARKNSSSASRKSSTQQQQVLLSTKEGRQRGKRKATPPHPASAGSTERESSIPSEEEDSISSCVAEAEYLQRCLLMWMGACTITDVLQKIEENTRRWHRWRAKASVSSDFSGLGVVVPYDKETEKGYRFLCSDTQLKKIVTKIKTATAEERDTQPLQELVNLAGIAVDESDVGAALQLGRNLFLSDSSGETSCRMIRPAKLLLTSAYTVLEEPYFAKVTEALAAYRLSC